MIIIVNTDQVSIGKSFTNGVTNLVERNLRSCILHDSSLSLVASEKGESSNVKASPEDNLPSNVSSLPTKRA